MNDHSLNKNNPAKRLPMGVLLGLSLAALGVVYGDIGTSPLYAMSQIFFAHGAMTIDRASVFGVVSLIFWALTLIVTLKYVVFVLRAEYEGEGGIFALFGLLKNISARGIAAISGLLLLAAGLLIGDGMITPAISVLSAIEGLSVETLAFRPFVIPITMIILSILFFFQYKGTAKLGKGFGIVMCVWFATIAILGIAHIVNYPAIFLAINPMYAFAFMVQAGIFKTMLVLGGVVLVVTGGEALYADLGHFGVQPIRTSWLFFVYPALILNYAGQGAYLLSGGPIVENNIFFSLVPAPLLFPMIILAALATIIASQALISGAFSLAVQAASLDVLPRLKVEHTSHAQKGQIYVPAVNVVLYIGCMLLVLAFRSSANLASAYGLAETGVMITTSITMIVIAIKKWKWKPALSVFVFGGFMVAEIAFLFSNSVKFLEGGYVPLTIGLILFSVMRTWRWGKTNVRQAYQRFRSIRAVSWLLDVKNRIEANDGVLIDDIGRSVMLSRAVVFLCADATTSLNDPASIGVRLYLKQKGAVPKCIVLLNISIDKEPYLNEAVYEGVVNLDSDIYAVNARYGFMEEVRVRELLAGLSEKGKVPYNIAQATIQVWEPEIIIDEKAPTYGTLRMRFYKLLYRMAVSSYRYFGLEADANIAITLIPVLVTREGIDVIRLDNEQLMI